MADEVSKIENASKPPLTFDQNGVPPKKKPLASLNLKSRVCYVITRKKSSSWVDDICNHERLCPDDHVYH